MGVPATCQGSETFADESKDTASDKPTVKSIAINAIPNFIDITLSGSSFHKLSSSNARCPAVWTLFTPYRQRSYPGGRSSMNCSKIERDAKQTENDEVCCGPPSIDLDDKQLWPAASLAARGQTAAAYRVRSCCSSAWDAFGLQ